MNARACFYCDGTGWLDDAIQIAEDDFRGCKCDHCDGSGIASVRAGARNTGPKRHVYGFGFGYGVAIGDPLEILATARRNKLQNKEPWREPSLRANYGAIRALAMYPALLPGRTPVALRRAA